MDKDDHNLESKPKKTHTKCQNHNHTQINSTNI